MTKEEREQAIATGVGLIRAGAPIRAASAEVGIPRATLHEAYIRVLGPDAPDAAEQRKRADERIMATAYRVAEGTLGRMAAELDDAEHKTVTAWADVSSKVLSRLRGWDAKSAGGSDIAPRWLSAISNVLEHGGATLTVTLEPNAGSDNTSNDA